MKFEWTDDLKQQFDEEQQKTVEKLVQSHEDKIRTEYSQKLNDMESKIQELEQYKPEEKSEEQKKIEEKENELWQKQVDLTLKENGLDGFEGLITAKDEEDLNNKVEQLNNVLKKKKVNNSYVPREHGSTDKYSQAKQEGNPKEMIKSLINK
ncbi:hypothetical protein [Natranaerobius thermophilus]|uniref:Phage scaffold protein n=1 Tax=Natranaerobius thermophilus (strain ATCC BAA-1301 / DSM 18059 / JW/NM-WN-LF) TaxID=457570 RepID=B2A212_NATTJ|nr:hypothetical protein [Natranaerobius thermophilus]ACB84817.1 conserved hypothetical protein [Natranaerobius thermophilus JW/NM-WN-LF]